MENHGLLSPRSWFMVRKPQIAGAIAGGLVTVATHIGARTALEHGNKPLGLDIVALAGTIDWPAYWLSKTLRLPIDFWEYTFLPGTPGLICATVLNALLLAAVGVLVGWFWRKSHIMISCGSLS